MLDIFDDDELSALEADLITTPARPMEAPPPPPRSDGWMPRVKGEAIDRSDPRYLAELEAAQCGIHPFARMQYALVQFLDHGEATGAKRYSLKIETVAAPVETCTRANLRQMARTRWANLTTPTNFRTNCRKRRWRDRKTGRPAWPETAWGIANEITTLALEFNANHPALPPTMIGFISCPFAGVQTYAGQFALVAWRDEGGDFLPVVYLTQPSADDPAGWEARQVDLNRPSLVNRDGTPRSEIARRHYPFMGTWYSPELQERITRGREIKAMRAADIAAKGGKA